MQTRREGMLVELFGVAGAGKSTLADAVAKATPVLTRYELSKSWQHCSRSQKSAYIARSFSDLPSVARAMQMAGTVPLWKRESLHRLFRLLAKRAWLHSQTRVLLLDQGLLQELWSVLFSAGC